MNTIVITKFTKRDVVPYLHLCQKIFEATYANEAIGFPTHLLGPRHFFTDEMQEYFEDIMVNRDDNQGFVAKKENKIVGGIAIREYDFYSEVKGFYVAEVYQGSGIGKRLWYEATKRIDTRKPIELGVFAHNKKSIEMYEKWGFKVCPQDEWGVIHWSTWPKKYIFPLVKMRKEGSR